MRLHRFVRLSPILACMIGFAALAHAQDPVALPQSENGKPQTTDVEPPPPSRDGPPPFPFGPDGPPPEFRGRGGGPGGFGPMREEVKLVEKFDADDNGYLHLEERKAAREFIVKERAEQRAGRPRGGPFGRRENQQPPEPGLKLTPADVQSHRAAPLYDPQTVRTFFLEFENPDWEKELVDFHGTDVEVPATLTVDGKSYKDVGVHFRGMSSFMMVGEGRKRSLNLSLDFVHKNQDLRGYQTLNLLNSNGDPTFLRAVLFHQIAREYLPSLKANFVRVAINGESWGIYVNVQQFNKDFVKEWFGTKKGARWKAPGSPGGRAGLEYLGDDVAEYKKRFEIKSKDDSKSWEALINLCRVLNQTPVDQLEKALEPILDIDGVLKFLALENVFINTDGYWTRASDYNLYHDEDGRFHLIPHDVNETFRQPEGPGRRGEEQEKEKGKGVELDPLAGSNDTRKPLLNKLLAVPSLRIRYLTLVREITEKWLNWEKIGPIAQQYHSMIADDVKTDTRKISSLEAFTKGVTEDVEEQGFRGPRRSLSLKSFVEQRRAYLLSHPEIQKTAGTAAIQ